MKLVLLELLLMKFIPRISKEIKWKVKVVLLESIIDEHHSWDIHGDEKEGERAVA